MSSARFDQAAGEQLAQTVREIEKKTDAEIVIVVRGRSGSYAHADYLCGAILAFLGLLFVLFSPFDFHTYWVPIDVLVLFIAGAYVCSRSHLIRRLLTTENFRSRAARTGAAAMFYEAGIANTLAENGVLVYLSLLERRVEVIADRGILKVVPALEWNNALFELKDAGRASNPAAMNAALLKLGELLAEYLPPTGENPNELADAPRIELR
jgi:putative membrane protein